MKSSARKRLALGALGALSYAGVSWLAGRRLAGRLVSARGLEPTAANREDLLAALGAAGVSVEVLRHAGSARSPVDLFAIFATPGDPSRRATLLFLHGKGGSSAEWRPDALRALALGYNVLIPDLRGHWPSGGDFVTYGFLEKDDLDLAVSAASDRFEVDPARLGVHACSAGATIALEFAARRTDIRAMWLESPYADPSAMARRYLSIATRLPAWFLWLTARSATSHAIDHIRRNLDLTDAESRVGRVDPVASLSRIHCPICLVSGTEDWLVPPRFARRLEAILPAGSQTWSARGAGHCHHDNEAARVLAAEYERRWRDFFIQNLSPSTL